MKKITNGFVRSFNIKISSNLSNTEVCKDEYLAAIIQNPQITEDEIKKLPNSANIMLKEFAHSLYEEYQKVLKETESQIQSEATKYAEYAA